MWLAASLLWRVWLGLFLLMINLIAIKYKLNKLKPYSSTVRLIDDDDDNETQTAYYTSWFSSSCNFVYNPVHFTAVKFYFDILHFAYVHKRESFPEVVCLLFWFSCQDHKNVPK